jgi:uncharacterized pyridoxal phosphate-containing UPF0001 family protein
MNTREELQRNLTQVEETIESACRRVQRSRNEITLIAVTKMHPAEAIAAAAELGITHIGENKVQEFDSKQPEWIPLRNSHTLSSMQSTPLILCGWRSGWMRQPQRSIARCPS